MTNKYFDGFAGFCARQIIDSTDYFELTYKQGRGHFKVNMYLFITSFNQRDFNKVTDMIKTSDTPQVTAGYLNSIIKKIYADVKEMHGKYTNDKKRDDKEYQNLSDALKHLEKRNEILVKHFGVSPLIEEVKQEIVTDVEVVDTVESNENITPLKRCNVVRFIPTQVKPLWENGAIETHVGYNFEYRGMPLQVYRMDGWERTNSTVCRIFIVDPVIGLPITSYDGMLSELEDRLSEVFIGYLKTIESNKESIVQIARAFKALKAIA